MILTVLNCRHMILRLPKGTAARHQVELGLDRGEGIPKGRVSSIGMGNVSIDQALGSLGSREKAGKGQNSKDGGLHFC